MAVIADGAGSATRAEVGASIIVNSVLSHVKAELQKERIDYGEILREAAATARKAIAEEAKHQGEIERSYASTLLASILTPAGGGAMQIGDGVIIVGDCADEWSWMFWPQRGEYANTTFFLTDEDAMDRLEVDTFSGNLTDVALMSDGLEPLALNYADKSVYSPFLKGLYQPLLTVEGSGEAHSLSSSLEQFLASDRVRSRSDDDISLILATRRTHSQAP